MLVIKGFNSDCLRDYKRCDICQRLYYKDSLVKYHNKYYCLDCLDYKADYSTQNDYNYIKDNDKIRLGIELEFDYIADKLKAFLFYYKFKLCYDGSIDFGEFKSPIFNIHRFRYVLKKFYEMYKKYKYDSKLVSSHIHFSFIDREKNSKLWNNWGYLKEYFAEEESKFIEYLYDNYDLFGRKFNSYCQVNDYDSRYFFINNTLKNTIEFRLCKVVNYCQLKWLLKFILKFCDIIKKVDKVNFNNYKKIDYLLYNYYRYYNQKYLKELKKGV